MHSAHENAWQEPQYNLLLYNYVYGCSRNSIKTVIVFLYLNYRIKSLRKIVDSIQHQILCKDYFVTNIYSDLLLHIRLLCRVLGQFLGKNLWTTEKHKAIMYLLSQKNVNVMTQFSENILHGKYKRFTIISNLLLS